ncbi:hypothetical protein F8M41_012811 [Gigaspora margarita]|uniref:Mrr-like domain-containing protein n=1 Tax=Gigaspora margarita TaxID=4874 RepID=A0A8H4B3S1_GIGMA|nr:hypothetical protein F8M41_012811 [Gigaspora margarita]
MSPLFLKDYKSEFEEFLKNERAGLKGLTEDGIDKLFTDPNSGFEPGFKGELYEYYIFNLLKRNDIPVLKNASVFRYVTRRNGNGIYFSDGNMDLHGRYKDAFSFFIQCKFRVNNNSLSNEDIEKFLKTVQNNPHFDMAILSTNSRMADGQEKIFEESEFKEKIYYCNEQKTLQALDFHYEKLQGN